MNRIVAAALIAFAAVLCAPRAEAARIRVSQESRPGAGDFARNVLGHIQPAAAPDKTAAQFYAYSEVAFYSYSGSQPVLRPERSHVFLVRTKEGLVLFWVQDRANNEDGGEAAVRVEVEGTGVQLLVRDDPFSANDSYEITPDGKRIDAWTMWNGCCTDGLAAGPLAGEWKVYLQFTPGHEGLPQGLREWVAISGDNAEVRLTIQPGRRVLLEPMRLMVRGAPPAGGGTLPLRTAPARPGALW